MKWLSFDPSVSRPPGLGLLRLLTLVQCADSSLMEVCPKPVSQQLSPLLSCDSSLPLPLHMCCPIIFHSGPLSARNPAAPLLLPTASWESIASVLMKNDFSIIKGSLKVRNNHYCTVYLQSVSLHLFLARCPPLFHLESSRCEPWPSWSPSRDWLT